MTMFMLPVYRTLPRMRMPAAATEPNSTIPAPPSTGSGIAAINRPRGGRKPMTTRMNPPAVTTNLERTPVMARSEEHTSELQSRFELVCRLLLEKKNPQYLKVLNYINTAHI